MNKSFKYQFRIPQHPAMTGGSDAAIIDGANNITYNIGPYVLLNLNLRDGISIERSSKTGSLNITFNEYYLKVDQNTINWINFRTRVLL